jgi:hypothetical protein
VHKCWECKDSHPRTLIIEESVRTVRPKDADVRPKAQSISVSADNLNQTELKENAFLKRTVTCDKTRIYYFTPESNRPSLE